MAGRASLAQPRTRHRCGGGDRGGIGPQLHGRQTAHAGASLARVSERGPYRGRGDASRHV